MPPTLAILRVKHGLKNMFCPACGEAIEPGSPDRAALHIIAGSRCHLVCEPCGEKLDPALAAVASKTFSRAIEWTDKPPAPMYYIGEIVQADPSFHMPEIVPPADEFEI